MLIWGIKVVSPNSISEVMLASWQKQYESEISIYITANNTGHINIIHHHYLLLTDSIGVIQALQQVKLTSSKFLHWKIQIWREKCGKIG